MGASISCDDCCCGGTRHEREFVAGRDKLSGKTIWAILTNNQIIIELLLAIQLIYICLWIALSFISGFALYTVDASVLSPTGWGHSISHFGWWLIIEVVLAWFLKGCTKFSLVPPNQKSLDRLQMSAARARETLLFDGVFVFLTIWADIAHMILTAWEIGDNESTLALANMVFLCAYFGILIAYSIVIKPYLLWRIRVYYIHLGYICKGSAVEILDISPKKWKAKAVVNSDDEAVDDNNNSDDDESTPMLKAMEGKKK